MVAYSNRPTGGVDPLQAAQDAAEEVHNHMVGETEEEGKLSITSIDTNTLATRYIHRLAILKI